MKRLLAILTAALIFLCSFSVSWAEGGFDLESRQAFNAEDAQNKINVMVDPRIELILIVQRLSNASNKYKTREYEFLYKNEINTYFGDFKNLDAVEMFNEYSLKYPNFFTSMPQAVLYLSAPPGLEEQFPVPSSLIAGVGGKQVFEEFIRALRDFANETKFMDFYNSHQLMYAKMVDGVYQNVPDVKQIVNTVEKYFGEKRNSYTVILSPIAFAAGFWPSVSRPDGSKDLFYVMQPTGLEEGIPVFYSGGGAEDLVTQTVQGFSYSFVSPVVSKYSYDMSRTVSLYEGSAMSRYFNSWNSAVTEQIVRSIAIKLGHKEDGNIIKRLLYMNYESGFKQILDIANRLDEYENQRNKYSTFQDFFPRIVNLFEEKGGNPGELNMEIGGTLSVKGIAADALAGKGYKLRVLVLEDKELTKLISTRTYEVSYLPYKWRALVPKKEHFYAMFFIDVNNNMKKDENEPFTSVEVKAPGGKSDLSINATLDFAKINLQSLTGYPSSSQVIKFTDPGLEAAVRSVLKKPYGNLLGSDVLRVTGLTAQNKNISNLEGLQYLKNLKYLDLQTNKIEDLAPVKDLVKLESLHVSYNNIKDISPIKDLTYLKNLQVSNNLIEDISALENLSYLEYLIMNGNMITDISALKDKVNLKTMSIVDNKVADIEPLKGSFKITYFNVQNNLIENIDALIDMSEMNYLNLWGNKISDIGALKNMAKLKTLYLGKNPILDYSPVMGIIDQLEKEDFKFKVQPITEQEIIFPDLVLEKAIRNILKKPEGSIYPSDALRFTKISIQGKGITSIEGLQYFKNLQSLELSTNQIEDLSPLKDLKKLESLYIGWNKIKDISPLKDLVYLRNLQFTMNEVEDISALADMTRLEYLAFGSNLVSDISPVKDMVLLNKLGFVHNKITDIEPIRGLTKITNLQVQGNQISDISPLSGMVDMDYLNIGFNNISDISPLKNMTKLKTLLLRNNPIRDYMPIAGIYEQLRSKDFNIE